MACMAGMMMADVTASAQTNDSISIDTTLWYNQTQQLGEVVVKSRLPRTKLKGNSMVTRIKGSVLAQSGTAQEMLAKVPGMTAKGEELEVLGKGTPVIYINGRKMHDKEELKRLRSEEIASVEVITNPGAQYEATISSVVRIKTIRREGDGFGFDLNTGLNQDLRDKGVLNIAQNSHSRNHFKNNGIDYNLGFNWQIAENHSVGFRVQRNDRFNATTDLMLETDVEHRYLDTQERQKEHSSSTQDEHRHTLYNWEGNAYYNGKVGKMGIDLNMDFLTDKTNVDNHINELVNHADRHAMEQDISTTVSLWATKLVLTYPVVKETYTKPIFFIDLNNTFRLPHRWQLEANMNRRDTA